MGYIFAFCLGFLVGGFVVIGASVAYMTEDKKEGKGDEK